VSLEANPGLVGGSSSDSDLSSRVEAQRRVQMLANALSPAEMEVLVLHFVDEFSVKEIARIVGRSRRAVDSLLYRAKGKARERLARDDD
jgi:RNA polymerase sigma factor (sigma-70 family)